MRIKITSDSTCDLSEALKKEYNITTIPLHIVKDEEIFSDGVDITPEIIYEHVSSGGDVCTTSAVNIGEYRETFGKFSADYDAVIHINLGSGFSSCFQNACIAATDFDNVYPVDSQNLSTGQGMAVLKACELAGECNDIEQLLDEIEEYITRIEMSFILDRLDYLAKGGRCSSILAMGANLLKLKPCIEVVGNAMRVGKKYRGTFGKCVGDYINDRLYGRDDTSYEKMILVSTEVSNEDISDAKSAVSKADFNSTEECLAGCTIACHCGPCTLGLTTVRK